MNQKEIPMSSALEVREAPTPLALLQSALERGVDPESLSKLMDLQERYQRNEAAQSFAASLAKFQSLCPRVTKDRTASITSERGSYKYNFASYDDVMRQAQPHLESCGLCVSFSTAKSDTGIVVTCRIRHGIHFEDHTLDVPVPAMKVNDTQRFGAALSYAKRYALCAALNIVVTDDVDDDGASQYETIDEQQAATLQEWIATTNTQPARFLNAYGIKQLLDFPRDRFDEAIQQFKRKQAKQT